MTPTLRLVFSFALALSVGLGSLTHAIARHQAQGAETLVICAGYGLVQVTIDADGNRVEQTLPCPDCLLSALALLPAQDRPAHPAAVMARLQPITSSHLQTFGRGFWPRSRAPPVPI